jgi:diguanylate cyclase (GGDEF)-like protein
VHQRRFKAVNDTLGHPAGDRLLCEVAERMRNTVRDVDIITRLGGDEFAIMLVGVDQPPVAETLAHRLVDVLARPYDIAGHPVVIGVSIGITLVGGDELNVERLLHQADIALYAAKRDGRGTWRWFEPAMDEAAQVRHGLEMDIRHALEHDEFELYYQPRVTIADGQVRGFEALLRWHHPMRGLVLPGDFISCAEETGLIVPLGAWILRTALKQAAQWPAGVRVAVNLSPYQMARDDLADMIEAALAETGQTGARLELEITENALLEHYTVAQQTLKRLGEIGVQIAMDDFGTGYSSLSHLRIFQFHRIKIDQSFIGGMTESPRGGAIVRGILQLATSLAIAITAEGVETQRQLDQLAADGCDEAQGYLFSAPQPADRVPGMLGRWTADRGAEPRSGA